MFQAEKEWFLLTGISDNFSNDYLWWYLYLLMLCTPFYCFHCALEKLSPSSVFRSLSNQSIYWMDYLAYYVCQVISPCSNFV